MRWPETFISLGHLCASAAANWYLRYSGNLWYPLTLNPVMLDNLWVLIWKHTGNKSSHSKHHSAVFISEHNNGTTRHCSRFKLLPFRLSKICAILVALEPVSPPPPHLSDVIIRHVDEVRIWGRGRREGGVYRKACSLTLWPQSEIMSQWGIYCVQGLVCSAFPNTGPGSLLSAAHKEGKMLFFKS